MTRRLLPLTLVAALPAARPMNARDCGRPLKQVRAAWLSVESDTTAAACRTKEALWLELRKCFVDLGHWLPWVADVGDCFVENQQAEAAAAFYQRVLRSVRDGMCTGDGFDCGEIATQELRRLACGFSWLAPDPKTAWDDLAGALQSPETATGAALHLEPVVDVRHPDPMSDFSCVPGAFAVPKAVLRRASLIRDALAKTRVGPLERVVSFELTEDDGPWSPHGPRVDGPVFLRIQVCRWPRPFVGLGAARYFVELNLASPDERTTRACEHGYSWVARRIGLQSSR